MTDEIFNQLDSPDMTHLMDLVVNHGYMPLTEADNHLRLKRLYSQHFNIPEYNSCCAGTVIEGIKRIYLAYLEEKLKR